MKRTSYSFLQEIRPRTIFVEDINKKKVNWENLNWYNKLRIINYYLKIKKQEEISKEDLENYIFCDIHYDPVNIQILFLKIRKITYLKKK